MFSLTVKNKYGQTLELTHNKNYTIESIEGLDPADATNNFTKNAGADGSTFNSSYIDNKQIIINVAIEGPAEANRLNLYKYFKNKYPTRLYFKNGSRDVYIDGFCKSIHIGFFDKKQIAQIVIECPDPFFIGSEEEVTEFSRIQSLFEFPFSISNPIPFSEIIANTESTVINRGDIESGCIIKLIAAGTVVDPEVINTETNQFFRIETTMSAGDEIHINTKRDQKAVELISDGTTESIISSMDRQSTWFVLEPGDNLFAVTAESGSEYLKARFILDNCFEGV